MPINILKISMAIHSKNRFTAKHKNNMSMSQKFGIIDKIKDGKKLCTKCNRILSVDKFDKSSKRSNGLQLFCKECGYKEKKNAYDTYRKAEVCLSARKTRLKADYGMTIEQYDEMIKEQKGLCAICGRKPQKGGNQFVKNFLVIDHDHKTGKVRGLLCSECNLGLSKFEDNPKYFENAIKYLKEHEEIKSKQT